MTRLLDAGPGRRPDAGELAPVATALREAATSDAGALLAAARSEAAAIASGASLRASRLLAGAGRDGAAAAREAGRGRLAEARRRGRTTVLEAHQAEYLSLRSSVTRELQGRLSTPDGQRLRTYLIDLVSLKSGTPTVEQFGADGTWRAVAQSGSTFAALDLEAVVDQVLPSFASDLGQLWS